MRDAATALAAVQAAHRGCTRCVKHGYLARAHPVFSGNASQRILLVGQAPGPVEDDVTRPFAGRAGAELMRWLRRAGFASETEVRHRVFMTSMTTCFPGRLPGKSGDRRPSSREVALCSGWLEAYLDLLEPRLILCIGALALGRFLPGSLLDDVVGHAWTREGVEVAGEPSDHPVVFPLPHPSGQSRWLNDPGRRGRLEDALSRLAPLAEWADGGDPGLRRRPSGPVL